ncbi:hypothetical protein [Salinarchaeum laminariae]|uniref:hypothetical protein n=1 Tax=Salinarchaeum laminariae TaxID=869888 RepID=UPI0020C02BE7|nr:hypothetical protein [Salinarchaeum laminariae]
MTNSEERDRKHARNRHQREQQIKRWAAFVRSHSDEEWGPQVNALVDAQLASAQHYGEDRPSTEQLRSSPLFDDE